MHILFVIVALAGLGYFLLSRRRFDFLSLGYLSACVYFLPGFANEALYPLERSHLVGLPVELDPRTQGAMILVLAVLLVGAFAMDLLRRRTGEATDVYRIETTGDLMPHVCLFFALLGFVMTWFTMGADTLLGQDKTTILEESNRWGLLWSAASTLGFVVAFANGRKGIMLAFLAMLLVETYIGFRTSIAICALACVTLWLHAMGAQRVAVTRVRVLLVSIPLTLFFFVYKYLYVAVKAGEWELVGNVLLDVDFYISTVLRSEPFITQAILNEVIIQEYGTGWTHLLDAMYAFLIFAPDLGIRIVSFNDMFQPDLFPNVIDSGLASNIWAQMISAGGWPLFVIFAVAHAALLYMGSRWLLRATPNVRALLATTLAFWAFYLHRNDLLFQFTIEKRIVVLFAVCYAVSRVAAAILESRRGPDDRLLMRRS